MITAEQETELARALISGDPEAFERFVDVYRTRVFQYSYLMCGHREDAEEVAQETLLNVFAKLNTLREPDRMRPWVFQIAKNACLMKRRRSIFAPAHEVSLDAQPAESPLQIRDRAKLPDEAFAQKEVRSALTQAISELPPAYRSVVLLRDMEELSTREAAEILDVSEDVVKQRLHRARVALRERMEELLGAAPGRNGGRR